jgi:hypothetical protein
MPKVVGVSPSRTDHKKSDTRTSTPFYISPIHRPSTHPRFLHLEAESDFAGWLSVEEGASTVVEAEVWYEDENSVWSVLKDMTRIIRLDELRRSGGDGKGKGKERDNSLEFTFDFDAKGVYCIPDESEVNGSGDGRIEGPGHVVGIVERSMRETRMKKGIGVGALHQ